MLFTLNQGQEWTIAFYAFPIIILLLGAILFNIFTYLYEKMIHFKIPK